MAIWPTARHAGALPERAPEAWLRRECRALKQEPCQGRADTVRAGPLGAIDLYQKGKIGAGAGAAAAHAGWAGSHGASGWPAKLAMGVTSAFARPRGGTRRPARRRCRRHMRAVGRDSNWNGKLHESAALSRRALMCRACAAHVPLMARGPAKRQNAGRCCTRHWPIARQRNRFDSDTMELPVNAFLPPQRRSCAAPLAPSRHGQRAAPRAAARVPAARRRSS